MSTILDALRKLQRERVQDLHESVAIDDPFSRAGRPRWPVVTLLVLLLAGAGAGAYYVWTGGAGIEQASPTDPPAERAAALVQREAASAVAPGPEPSARQRKALALARARQRAERVERGRVSKAPPAEPEPSPARSASNPTTARGPAAGARQVAATQSPGRTGAASAPFLNDEPATPRPQVSVGLVLEAVPRTRSQPEPEPDIIFGTTIESVGFPDLQVESVRWHPEPERREARILLDDTRPIDAREGDVIAGVAIYRIDPGAVEFRVGDLHRRLLIGP